LPQSLHAFAKKKVGVRHAEPSTVYPVVTKIFAYPCSIACHWAAFALVKRFAVILFNIGFYHFQMGAFLLTPFKPPPLPQTAKNRLVLAAFTGLKTRALYAML
jgi:hypothetical protein